MNLEEKIKQEFTVEEVAWIYHWFYEQGRETYETEIKDTLILEFGKRKMMMAVEHTIDLYDLDRWVICEKMLGMELEWQNVKNLNAALWEKDIEILELSTPTR